MRKGPSAIAPNTGADARAVAVAVVAEDARGDLENSTGTGRRVEEMSTAAARSL
jgi:hypothetical protein